MSAAALARQIDAPTNHVTDILNGRRAVTADTVLGLAHLFGTRADSCMNLQEFYDLRRAEEKAGEAIRRLPTSGRREAVRS